MINAKCIQKFRDKNNNIIGYRLEDTNGNRIDVKPNELKQAIVNKQINIINFSIGAGIILFAILILHFGLAKK